MSRSIRFWNWIAERYARQPIADPETYELKLDLTRQYLSGESVVVEFGCGTGSTALIHAEGVKSILAIDNSPKMIEICNRKLAESDPGNVEFRCAELPDLGLLSESVDAVLGLNVLHLIDSWEDCVEEAWRMLKPGGVLVTSTVCLGSGFSFLRLVLPVGGALGLVPSVQFIDEKDVVDAMTARGFEIVERMFPPRGALFLVAQKSP